MEKFDFNRDFELEEGGASTATVRRQGRSAKLDEAHAAGYAEGQADAVAEAERHAAHALELIAEAANQLLSTVSVELDQARDESTRLASHIARKLIARLVDDKPEAFLAETIDACLQVARREPNIMIEIPDAHQEKLEPLLNDKIAQVGLTSRVQIISNPSLGGSQCLLDWTSGGAEISLDEILGQVETVIEEQIAATQLAREQDMQVGEQQIA